MDDHIQQLLADPTDDDLRARCATALAGTDPTRSEFLLVEQEWARSSTKSVPRRLRSLAASLDPVWVARVSRPPLGVFSDRLQFTAEEDGQAGCSPLSLQQLKQMQRKGIDLPAACWAFLLNYNGGWVSPNRVSIPGYGPGAVVYFYTVYSVDNVVEDDTSLLWKVQEAQELRADDARWRSRRYTGLVPFAWAGPVGELEWVCVDTRTKHGKLVLVTPWLWEDSVIPDWPLAPSLPRLLAMIHDK